MLSRAASASRRPSVFGHLLHKGAGGHAMSPKCQRVLFKIDIVDDNMPNSLRVLGVGRKHELNFFVRIRDDAFEFTLHFDVLRRGIYLLEAFI